MDIICSAAFSFSEIIGDWEIRTPLEMIGLDSQFEAVSLLWSNCYIYSLGFLILVTCWSDFLDKAITAGALV